MPLHTPKMVIARSKLPFFRKKIETNQHLNPKDVGSESLQSELDSPCLVSVWSKQSAGVQKFDQNDSSNIVDHFTCILKDNNIVTKKMPI